MELYPLCKNWGVLSRYKQLVYDKPTYDFRIYKKTASLSVFMDK